MGILMGNGNHLAQILIYGFTENVRVWVFHIQLLLLDFSSVAGAGKSILWYVKLFRITPGDLRSLLLALRSLRTSITCANAE